MKWKDENGYDADSPSDLVCGFLDNGRLGLDLIAHLAEYGWEIARIPAPPAPAKRIDDGTSGGKEER